MSVYCYLCETQVKATKDTFCRSHLKWTHNIPAKEYYDRFLRKQKEGECPICQQNTVFISAVVGYKRFCSTKCAKENLKRELMDKFGVTNISQLQSVKDKKKSTCLEHFGQPHHMKNEKVKKNLQQVLIDRYGIDNPSKNQEFVKKRHQTIARRYGKRSYAQTLTFRESQELIGKWVSIENKSDFELYRMMVWNETRKWKKALFSGWNGTCAYSQEKLTTDTNEFNSKLYATIDHKVSVFHGFKNNIDPLIIGGLNNLCICSRSYNSMKAIMTDAQFKKHLSLLR